MTIVTTAYKWRVKAAIEREKSDACISSAEREQARPQVKNEEWRIKSEELEKNIDFIREPQYYCRTFAVSKERDRNAPTRGRKISHVH